MYSTRKELGMLKPPKSRGQYFVSFVLKHVFIQRLLYIDAKLDGHMSWVQNITIAPVQIYFVDC